MREATQGGTQHMYIRRGKSDISGLASNIAKSDVSGSE